METEVESNTLNYIFIFGLLLLLAAIFIGGPIAQVSTDEINLGQGLDHAVEKHGMDAIDTLKCWFSGGTILTTFNPTTGRELDICQPKSEPEQWGYVVTEGKDLVTAFIDLSAETIHDVMYYVVGRGYLPFK